MYLICLLKQGIRDQQSERVNLWNRIENAAVLHYILVMTQIRSLQKIVQDLQGANADPAQMRAREMSKELKPRVNGKHNNQQRSTEFS